MENVSDAAFKEFFQFFYRNEVELTAENIADVLNLLKQSLVDGLVTESSKFIINNNAINTSYRKEIDVFEARMEWIKAKSQQNSIEAITAANQRMALGEALFKIRFCSMKTEELAIIRFCSALSIAKNIDILHAAQTHSSIVVVCCS